METNGNVKEYRVNAEFVESINIQILCNGAL